MKTLTLKQVKKWVEEYNIPELLKHFWSVQYQDTMPVEILGWESKTKIKSKFEIKGKPPTWKEYTTKNIKINLFEGESDE